MTRDCQDFESRLDDWLDGELDEAAGRELTRHAADCARCGATLEAARRLQRAVAGLPREVAPARDLLPGIRSRMDGAPRNRRHGAGARWGALAAAVLLATLSAVVAVRTWNRSDPTPVPGTTPAGAVPAAGSIADLDELEAEYERAVSALVGSIEQRRGSLSPETEELVRSNLELIDQAIQEIRTALGRAPGPDKQRLLTTIYRQKIDLLWKVSKLSSLGEAGEGQDHAT